MSAEVDAAVLSVNGCVWLPKGAMAESGSDQIEIFLVSDGTGETGTHAVRAAATQFQRRFRLRTFADTRHASQVRRIMERAREASALVVFTLVNDPLKESVRALALEMGVPAVDLLSPLISAMSHHYSLSPQHRVGVLHGFGDEYFRRVEAVEFAVRHDDGANLHTLHQADIVLAGVSRTSKTPLSMYLAQRGYKTGNVPIVPGIEPPRELLEMDARKVIGLVIEPNPLLEIRKARIRQLGASPYTTYAEPEAVVEELQRARRLFNTRQWRSVNTTGKAIEENAARILELMYGSAA
jgi:[pyruvate, water dikinase]-phosphate phosphotransferase / [pyruvate, water dikinase] kinase